MTKLALTPRDLSLCHGQEPSRDSEMQDWKKVEVFGLNDTEAWRWEVTCS